FLAFALHPLIECSSSCTPPMCDGLPPFGMPSAHARDNGGLMRHPWSAARWQLSRRALLPFPLPGPPDGARLAAFFHVTFPLFDGCFARRPRRPASPRGRSHVPLQLAQPASVSVLSKSSHLSPKARGVAPPLALDR